MSQPLTFPRRVPTLAAGALTLREMAEADVPAWFKRASDPDSAALSGDSIPESIDDCYGWLQAHRDLFDARRGIRWAIVPENARVGVGSIGLSNICTAGKTAELGAVVGRAYRGRGIGTAAARLVVAYALEELGLAGVRADFVEHHVASKRILEKLGFRFERVLENYRGTQVGVLYVKCRQDEREA